MVQDDHSFTKTGRQRRASYAPVAEWVVKAWAKITSTTIKNGFRKAQLSPELLNSEPSASSDDESEEEDAIMDITTITPELSKLYHHLFKDDTDDEDFDGFDSVSGEEVL